jgi:heme exporter protein C
VSRAHARTAAALATVTIAVVSVAVIFTRTPIEKEMREAQKIFYFHVGSAWTMFVAFAVTAAAGVVYVLRPSPRADAVAGSSAEIGFVLATNVLLSGSLWARSAWNTWWNWEPRLTSMLVLWTIYAGYLLFRGTLRGETRRRHSSVLGIIAFVMVPVVWFSIRLWGSLLHPPTGTAWRQDPLMLRAMVLGGVTMLGVYVVFLSLRSPLERMRAEIEELRAQRTR